jgi:flap endonuclease-1
MGIKRLNKFLSEFGEYPLLTNYNNIREYTRKYSNYNYSSCAVDVLVYAYKFQYSYNDIFYGFWLQISRLLSNHIIPIYVFDGKPPIEKEHILKYRLNRKEKLKEKIRELENDDLIGNDAQIKKLNRQIINISKLDITNFKSMLDILHLPYIVANGEADAMCAKLCKEKYVDACLSEDMDLLTHGCTKLIKMSREKIIEYDLNFILDELNLKYEEFIDMCILFGCDYVNTIPRLKPNVAYDLIQKYKSIEEILNNTEYDKYTNFAEKYALARDIFTNSCNNEIINNTLKIKITQTINKNNLINFFKKNNIMTHNLHNIHRNVDYINKLINYDHFT